jgi:lycopene beta-cyclase
MLDVLIVGAGPAGLYLAATLGQAGFTVKGVSATAVTSPWPNTYGIWVDELEPLGLTQFLKHRWQDCRVYINDQSLSLNREYGLLDNDQLQSAWITQAQQNRVQWHQAKVVDIEHTRVSAKVTTEGGQELTARLVIDATGHYSPFIKRASSPQVAYQTAYGIVGRFSQPPIPPQQMVLMDYRDDHLDLAERAEPPTFLYGMDLGNGLYFVEETSLAHHPAIALDVLEKRLYQRLAHRQIAVTDIHHIEKCRFPMNLPLPNLQQPLFGFGGAASMVHPASGYLMGSILRRGPGVVQALTQALNHPENSPRQIAQAGWQSLWSTERLRKYYLYRFGLENLMAYDNAQLCQFFETFFDIDRRYWSGFMADTLTFPELLRAMLLHFGKAPNNIRWSLIQSVIQYGGLLAQTITPSSFEFEATK